MYLVQVLTELVQLSLLLLPLLLLVLKRDLACCDWQQNLHLPLLLLLCCHLRPCLLSHHWDLMEGQMRELLCRC
jgi:hypothetical protein